MLDFRDLTPPEIIDAVQAAGGTPHQGQRVARAVLRGGVQSVEELPVAGRLRQALSGRFRISSLGVEAHRLSKDGSGKFLYRLADGERVEGVLIPDRRRNTLCVSTQLGCRSGCAFCLSGSQGLIRNLLPAEMLGQIHAASRVSGTEIHNLVLMGSGEPLDNFENVKRFVQSATHRFGLNLSPRKITVSTSGIIPVIQRMPTEMPVSLAVSLNAPNDELRSRLMPINRKYPLQDLMNALRYYGRNGRRVFIEYILLLGVNDAPVHASALADLLQDLTCVVNLIRFNRYPGARFEPSSEDAVRVFQKILLDRGLVSVVRDSRGADIMAACGQLRAAKDPVPG